MDFIERLFHVSPDNGTGVTEALLLVGVLLILIMASVGVRVIFARLGLARRRKA
jgi:hypothetical protein